MNAAVIDAHQHFWRLSRGDYGWLTADLVPLYRDFEPAHLAPQMQAAGVERTVVVQAAPTTLETQFLLSLARQTKWIAGVVGWVDFDSPTAGETLAALACEPALVGVRPMIQDIPDPEWMLGALRAPVFEALVDCDLAFDALVRPHHLRHLRRLLDRQPDLRVVIDHAAKPDIAGGHFTAWADEIAGLARESSAVCKLSGLVTEARPGWRPDDLRRWVDHLLATFGPSRLLWGSDWPVVELAGGYRAWRKATQELLSELSPAERGEVLGGAAARFYRLTDLEAVQPGAEQPESR